ncbi:MAG: hypothetical protein HYZ93_05160 [Candidatus Omnitrophica bacterium]|nr:hypothetical protein [Candidatus Omnitrophota bacterium]
MVHRPLVILDPPGDPAANMAADEALAACVRRGADPPTLILRIYRWNQPAISLGRRQRLEDLPAELIRRGLPIVRRPTGGGAVVHSPSGELTYAVAIPRPLFPRGLPLHQVAGLLHRGLREELIRRGSIPADDLDLACAGGSPSPSPAALCFAASACGDLLYRGGKVAGSALRVWRDGLLLQGSIQGLPLPLEFLAEALSQAALLPGDRTILLTK